MKSDNNRSNTGERELTGAEWDIMKVVWEREPCTAGDVQEAVAEVRGWAYSTVKTTMDRMVKKGILKLKRVRNLQLFEARLSRAEVATGELRRLLDRAFDGAVAPMVNHLVENEDLSAEDLAALRQMIEQTVREGPAD